MKMKYATTSRLGRNNAKLLYMNQDVIEHYEMKDLADLIPPNSLMVVNQSATLPASFYGFVGSLQVELRLVRNLDHTTQEINKWEALLFYKGSWRDRTEDRLNPDFIVEGDIIEVEDLKIEVTRILHESKRLIEIEIKGEKTVIWNKIYRYGKPIQYSHLTEELQLWDIQTIFSSLPTSVEPASASFQFTWDIVNQLVKKGIEIVGLVHSTSISSTGIADIDENLPFMEYYQISHDTADTVQKYLDNNLPIIAVGTSVTRALEDNFKKFGKLKSGNYTSELVIDENHNRQVVSHLFTGMHLPEESHMKLLLNFASRERITKAYNEAIQLDYMWHEYGDVSLMTGFRQQEVE